MDAFDRSLGECVRAFVRWFLFSFSFCGIHLSAEAASVSTPPSPTKVAHSKEYFCAHALGDPTYFQHLSANEGNHLALINQGGLLDGGVCWWHSQFQRNSLYLAVFRPDLPKPSESVARDLIFKIRKGRAVTEIPGFSNLEEFSRAYPNEIEDKLEDWQLTDGFLKQKWIHGITPGEMQSPGELEQRMKNIYSEVTTKKRVTFIYLRSHQFGSHALLITSMTAVKNGFRYSYIDSNFPTETSVTNYQAGDLTLRLAIYDKMIPYIGQTGDFPFFDRAIRRYCGS